MRYYNPETGKYYIEGTIITMRLNEGSVFSGIPTVEQLTEWGYEESPIPQPVEPPIQDELLEAKKQKLFELDNYDKSDSVNSFTLNGRTLWLSSKVRQQLKTSLDAYSSAGIQNVTKWFNGISYTFPLSSWYQMLNALEIYASEALNVTESHKAAIGALSDIQQVKSYDFTIGYPSQLSF